MKKFKSTGAWLAVLAVLGVSMIMACAPAGGSDVDTTNPTIISTSPVQGATAVSITTIVKATFSEDMDAATIIAANFAVTMGTTEIAGTVNYDAPLRAVVFTPSTILEANTEYTVTVATGVQDAVGNNMAAVRVFTFTTSPPGVGPLPVNLRTVADFAVVAKTGVSTVPASVITGDVGLSPAAESYMTGFSQTDAGAYATSPQVTGYLYAADMAVPTPAKMTTVVSEMETAYADAAGRLLPNTTDLGAGEIGGQTLTPGLYKWTTAVTANSNFTISGGANDVWIFQIDGDLTVANAVTVTLSGAAQARNIFWQVGSAVSLGTTSHMEGTILCTTAIAMGTGSTMNGRALSQTAVSLAQATVTKPSN